MFDRLDELYISVLDVGPAYTELQMVDRAFDQVKQTRLHQQACIKR